MHTHIDHKILLKYTGLVKRYYTFIKQRTGNIMEDAELYQNNNSIQKHDAVETLEKYKNIQWRANASILDVGCGDGSVMTTVLMKYLPSDFQKLIGCDVSKNMLTFAREKYADERTDFILLDIEGDLPEELRQGFDHVFSNYALHWVKDDVRAFQNIYDLLKEDGSCLLITLGKHTPFDAFRIMSQRDKWKRYIHDPECIVSPYHDMKDPEIQIASVMKEIGFKNIEVKREKKTYNYDKAIHFMKCLQAANFYNIPADVYDDYSEELLQVFREMNLVGKKEDYGETLKIDYDLMVIYGSK